MCLFCFLLCFINKWVRNIIYKHTLKGSLLSLNKCGKEPSLALKVRNDLCFLSYSYHALKGYSELTRVPRLWAPWNISLLYDRSSPRNKPDNIRICLDSLQWNMDNKIHINCVMTSLLLFNRKRITWGLGGLCQQQRFIHKNGLARTKVILVMPH